MKITVLSADAALIPAGILTPLNEFPEYAAAHAIHYDSVKQRRVLEGIGLFD